MPHNPHMSDDPKEFLEERKAIMQYEGNMSQDKAEVLAYTRYIHKYRPDMIAWYPWEEIKQPLAYLSLLP